jgi:hypothetical protein
MSNIFRRWLSAVLSLILIFSIVQFHVYATDAVPTVTYALDKTTYERGDNVVVTVSISDLKEIQSLIQVLRFLWPLIPRSCLMFPTRPI